MFRILYTFKGEFGKLSPVYQERDLAETQADEFLHQKRQQGELWAAEIIKVIMIKEYQLQTRNFVGEMR